MACLAALAFSCGGGKENEDPDKGGKTKDPKVFTVQCTQTSVGPEAQTAIITVSCDVAWTISSDASWLTVSPTSGVGNATASAVSANIKINPQDSERTANITVTAGSKNTRVSITQRKVSEMLPATEIYLVKMETVDFSIITNKSWSATLPDGASEWLAFSPKSGTGSGTIRLRARDENENVGDRKTTLTINIGGDNIDIPVTHKQKNVIVLEDGKTVRDYQAGTFEVASNTNIDFKVEVTEGADWLHFVETKALNSKKTTFRIDQNPNSTVRTAKVAFTYGTELKEVHEVEQGPYNNVITKTIPGIYALGGKDYVYEAGKDQLSVTRRSMGLTLRVLSPQIPRIAEMNTIPDNAVQGSTFQVYYIVKEGRETVTSGLLDAYVIKTDDNYIWLSFADGTGAIIKK